MKTEVLAENESVVKYEINMGQSGNFQWTFELGEIKYLILDPNNVQNQEWKESSVLGTMSITNAKELSTGSTSTNLILGFQAMAIISALLLLYVIKGNMLKK